MFRISVAVLTFGLLLVLAGWGSANEYGYGCQDCAQHGGGLFGWRNYSFEERRNFPTCYGGYERYYGGFHATYFRNYPGNFDGLNNRRYGWGSGWAW